MNESTISGLQQESQYRYKQSGKPRFRCNPILVSCETNSIFNVIQTKNMAANLNVDQVFAKRRWFFVFQIIQRGYFCLIFVSSGALKRLVECKGCKYDTVRDSRQWIQLNS
jgi:hypothetical protein